MARFLKPSDTVIVDATSFQKFMDYREKNNLSTSWEWMTLPKGTLMEVRDLVFRTTGSKKRKRSVVGDNGETKVKYRKGRSCWVTCKVVMTGNEYTIPSWILKKSIVSHIHETGEDSDS